MPVCVREQGQPATTQGGKDAACIQGGDKSFFAERITDTQNSLPFERRLDKHCVDQAVKFNYEA